MVRTRRAWLAHCSALLAGLAAAGPMASRAAAVPAVILVVGDSLSAEYGLRRGSGWVALLQQRLDQRKADAKVVNASISGETSSGGRSRLPALLKQHRPTHVILELGANDALRGLPLTMTRDNLEAMAKEARAAGARLVVVGMQVPPNYGSRYTQDFAALFATVAKDNGATLVPFLLKGVADVPNSADAFQADGLHPKESAHPAILDNVWPAIAGQLGLR